ncbi:MAG: trypsin-like peptidase domain-containing protein [Anaerolineaceae bacterium]|nr:trypsin-like peptidase domain-containing protein [Anaerolineaceae bacterium]
MNLEKPTVSRSEVWRGRLRRFLSWVRKAVPFAAGVAAALIAILVYNSLNPGPQVLTSTDVSTQVAISMASATPPPAFSETVYRVIQPSLVLIEAQSPAQTKDNKSGEELGSGVVIDDAGDILTALHVVANAASIKVTFADGTQSAAQVTSTQPTHDIAVLQASAPPAKLVPATLGNPNSMQIGDEAYVVGNPFGLYGSMSAGVISGFNRSFSPTDGNSNQTLNGLIQIDAAVNPGNSGGPLLDRNGYVIGIIDGIVNPTGQNVFIGIGFAVPINVAGGGLGSPPD